MKEMMCEADCSPLQLVLFSILPLETSHRFYSVPSLVYLQFVLKLGEPLLLF